MSLAKSRLTAQSQISVPAEVRRKLGVGPGSLLEWEQVGDLMIVRRAGVYSAEDVHRVLFSEVPKRRSLKDLKDARGRYVREKHARG